MDVLWNIIMYAVPGGFAVQLINWYRNRKLSKARQGGDIDAAYLDNINMLREELIKIQDENRKLYRAIARLDRTVARATACRHWNDCPIRIELQKPAEDAEQLQSKRQLGKQKRVRSPARSRTTQHSEDEISDGYAEADSGGHRL